jgi:hypothetical protein
VTSPPVWVTLKPFFLSQARQATSWVFPSCGVATFFLLKSAGEPIFPSPWTTRVRASSFAVMPCSGLREMVPHCRRTPSAPAGWTSGTGRSSGG